MLVTQFVTYICFHELFIYFYLFFQVPMPRSEPVEIFGPIKNLPSKLLTRCLGTLGLGFLRRSKHFTIVEVTKTSYNWLNISKRRIDSTSFLKKFTEANFWITFRIVLDLPKKRPVTSFATWLLPFNSYTRKVRFVLGYCFLSD